MRVLRNDALIKKRTQFTQRGSLVGMGLLVVSLFLSTRNPILSWVLLLAGFITAMAAVRVGNRFVRPPRPDTVLDKVLKGLDNHYALYHFLLPADHVLVTPSGAIVIRAQAQQGDIVARGGRWRQRSYWQRMRVLFGESGLGNPDRQLERELGAVRGIVAEALGEEEDCEVPVDGVVVFYADKVRLEAEDTRFPTILPQDLKATVRSLAEAHSPLPGRSQRALIAAIEGEEPAAGVTEETVEAEEAPPTRSKRSRRRSKSKKTKKASQ
jgi:hypothetical protein